ncbi:MAG TPA: DNA repair protein RadC [Gammaproteobacteria bacterium]|nr:DNA repair protein RadC [Gammaproteobacteria bacterium]
MATVKEWPQSERPREKLLRGGPKLLSDGELLALLLGSGCSGANVLEVARGLLARCGGLHGVLACTPSELAGLKGLGPARVARLQAAIELGRRYLAAPSAARLTLKAPQDAACVFQAQLADLPHEVFSCLFLDTRHRVISYEELFRGTIDGAMVYPREVLKRALHHNASAVIVAHNHPSGVSEPSEADRSITLKLSKALALIDVRLLDHLIVSRGGHVSLAERGWV